MACPPFHKTDVLGPIQQQIMAMSKPNIKFIYTGQFRSEVQQLQKGPAKLENLYGSIIHPEYMPILDPQEDHGHTQVVSTMEVNSKPTSPNSIVRYKSAENIRIPQESRSSNATNNALNIEEINESEVVARQAKKANINSDQIVLNAPSYKFVPRKEGEIAVHSTKQYKKHTSVQKCLNSESAALRSRRQTNKNINHENDYQLKSNPMLKIETINERDFKTEPSEQQSSLNNSAPNPNSEQKVVLKAPKYKYVPKQQNDIAVNRKKEYVKAENTAEKYFYGGVQSRQESDFISCFGCLKPTAKTYQSNDE